VNDKPTIKGNISAYHLSGPIFLTDSFENRPFPPTFAALILFFMFAVVQIAGSQFRVQKDQTLYVPRVEGNAGDHLEFSDVLLSTAGDQFTTGKDVKSVVKVEILGHVQGNKVISFKMNRRKGFRKKHGHRTHYTKIKVTDIA
jgi:large subunit ribosomal protein L21